MSILPSFLASGILTVVISLLIILWSAAFVQRKNGGLVMIALSIALLLFGGGFFPPLIGIIGGAAGTKINKPLTRTSTTNLLRIAAKCWPWPLVIFLTWIFGQFLVGYFFNDFLQSVMGLGLLLIISTLALSVYTAYADDVQSQVNNS